MFLSNEDVVTSKYTWNIKYGIWLQNDQFLVIDLHNVMVYDSLSTSHPIFVAVQNPVQIKEIFDVISYSKLSNRSDIDIEILSLVKFNNSLLFYREQAYLGWLPILWENQLTNKGLRWV